MRSATLWCQAGAWINPSKAKGVRHGQKVRGKAADADGGDAALFEKAMAFRPNMLWLLEQHQVKRARDSTHIANTTLCPVFSLAPLRVPWAPGPGQGQLAVSGGSTPPL